MSRRLDISHTAPPTRPIYPWDPFIWSASWFFYHENESKNNKMSPGSVASYDLKNDINLFYSRCFRMLDTDYKFYLAFENSNCKDYITEKFFVNGLGWVLLFTTKSQLWNNFKIQPQCFTNRDGSVSRRISKSSSFKLLHSCQPVQRSQGISGIFTRARSKWWKV